MKQRTRILLACIAIAGMLLGAGSPALAEDPHKRIILTYVFNDPDHVASPDVLLAEMRRTGNLDRFGLKPGVETTLHRAGAQVTPTVPTYTTMAGNMSAVTPGEKTYDYITPEECDAHYGQSEEPAGWIKNHFAYCQEHQVVQFALSCPVPELCLDGLFGATVVTIGFGKTGIADGTTASRWAKFQFHLKVMFATGVFNQASAKLRVTLPCHGRYDNSADGSPANACHGAAGEAPAEKSIPDWRSNPDAYLSLVSDAATPDSSRGQQIARAEFRPEYHFTIPSYHQFYTPKGETGGMRFDSAWYLTYSTGSIFDRTTPSIAYSLSDEPVKLSARHMSDALNYPASTYPMVTGKHIPGGSASDTIHRLYFDTKRRDDNRDEAGNVCDAQWPGYPELGQDCDEFPFATTYEGAARSLYDNTPYGMFSVRPINAPDNQLAGSRLGAWYGDDRILDGDPFFVRILP